MPILPRLRNSSPVRLCEREETLWSALRTGRRSPFSAGTMSLGTAQATRHESSSGAADAVRDYATLGAPLFLACRLAPARRRSHGRDARRSARHRRTIGLESI